MNELFGAIFRFFRQFQIWVVVAPWEQAVRVRLGKHLSVLNAGVHLKLPFADLVYLQSVRLRISGIREADRD